MSGNERRENEAMFRFQLVSLIRAREQMGEPRSKIVRELAGASHHDVCSNRVRKVSERSLYRYLKMFESQGVDGLQPQETKPAKRVLDDKLIKFLREEKEADPGCSVPEFLKRAVARDIISPEDNISRTTIWRRIKELGLPHVRNSSRIHNSRRFACENRMQIVLCDGKHFRAGAGKCKRVVLIFLDDATRFALHAVVGESESAHLFQRGLYELIQKHGLMHSLYMDHGTAFTARDSVLAIKNLGVHLILSTVGYPQGRGKIERFNRTLQNAVLRGFPGNDEIDPGCLALELQINHWLKRVYNLEPHAGLDGETPASRFFREGACALRFPEPEKLQNAFVIRHQRKVSSDNVISFESIKYEMPPGYARTTVKLGYKLISQELVFQHRGKEVVLHEVDPVYNATMKRPSCDVASEEEKHKEVPPPRTHASFLYETEHSPIVDLDGGYKGKTTETREDENE